MASIPVWGYVLSLSQRQTFIANQIWEPTSPLAFLSIQKVARTFHVLFYHPSLIDTMSPQHMCCSLPLRLVTRCVCTILVLYACCCSWARMWSVRSCDTIPKFTRCRWKKSGVERFSQMMNCSFL